MSANQNAWHALSSLGGPSRPAQPQVLLKSSGKYNVTKKVLNTMQFCQNYIYIYINMCDKTLFKKKNYPPTLDLLLSLPHDLSRRVPQREGQQCPVSTTRSPEKCLQMWKSHGVFPFGTKMYKWCFFSTSMFTGGQWEFITLDEC